MGRPMNARFALFIALVGCGTSSAGEEAVEAPEASGAQCHIPSGTSTLTVTVDGVARTATVRRGAAAEDKAPVVFAWHGFGSSGESMLAAVQPERHYPASLVVAPHGLGRTFDGFGDTPKPGWQIHAGELDDRDLKLFDALMAELEPCVDPAAVYSTGFSNGGFFSNVLGCHRPILTAIAPVGGGGPFADDCAPVPVLITHGRADTVVPFESAVKTAAAWARANGCTQSEPPVQAGCTPLACEQAVEFCSFEGNHTWPRTTADSVASFFKKHR